MYDNVITVIIFIVIIMVDVIRNRSIYHGHTDLARTIISMA